METTVLELETAAAAGRRRACAVLQDSSLAQQHRLIDTVMLAKEAGIRVLAASLRGKSVDESMAYVTPLSREITVDETLPRELIRPALMHAFGLVCYAVYELTVTDDWGCIARPLTGPPATAQDAYAHAFALRLLERDLAPFND